MKKNNSRKGTRRRKQKVSNPVSSYLNDGDMRAKMHIYHITQGLSGEYCPPQLGWNVSLVSFVNFCAERELESEYTAPSQQLFLDDCARSPSPVYRSWSTALKNHESISFSPRRALHEPPLAVEYRNQSPHEFQKSNSSPSKWSTDTAMAHVQQVALDLREV
jgi:hypothetical protein